MEDVDLRLPLLGERPEAIQINVVRIEVYQSIPEFVIGLCDHFLKLSQGFV